MLRLAPWEANIYHSFARQLFEGELLVNTLGCTVDFSLRKVRFASIYLKISDIAVVLDIPADILRDDIADRSNLLDMEDDE